MVIQLKQSFLFHDLTSYGEYLSENPFHELLGIDLSEYETPLDLKIEKSPYYSVDPDMKTPFVSELDDLIRLHYLVTTRRVSTILEFGVGKSTVVFGDAMRLNKLRHEDYYQKNLRRSNLFECHSVDNNDEWIKTASSSAKFSEVHYHLAECTVETFQGRICTFFDPLPNICPDFIYLDGPDQFSPLGQVRGIDTNHPDRLPMSADILAIEHFLLPGTLIVVDGRTANARFLAKNLQRDWIYHHDEGMDQHFFELCETPLGELNRKQCEYALGSDYFERVAAFGVKAEFQE